MFIGNNGVTPVIIRNLYMTALVTGFGTIVNIWGSLVLFEMPADGEPSLGVSTSRVSSIICAVTVPLVIMELIAGVSAVKSSEVWRSTEWFSGTVVNILA